MLTLPTSADILRIRREALLNRAIEAYKFFYPTVSQQMNFEALVKYGAPANVGWLIQLSSPQSVSLTQNSDTPYGLGWIDVSEEPIVVDVPAGPIIGVVNDGNFRYVTDIGSVGEEAGAGASYLFVSPGYTGDLPDGYLARRLDLNRALIATRAPNPDIDAGKALLRTIRMYPLSQADAPSENSFVDTTGVDTVANPCEVDGTFAFWEKIKASLDADVASREYYQTMGMLADLGLRKGEPFTPLPSTKELLAEAARIANEQLVVAAFASDSPDRLVWPDRQWEWTVLASGDQGYYETGYLRLAARERWFYQATLETPKMFKRAPGAGSLYWLGNRDTSGSPLDGGAIYTLTVSTPVPAAQFWSVTVYDLDTRSEIVAPQNKPLITSLRDDVMPDSDGNIVLHFGPDRPADESVPWVQTVPGRQWFAYFRIYGPGDRAFDGSWKPSDFVRR
ncbi:hypothetical protein GOARA_021_00600 [Gordonia araii NBRC 100433]|uniref:DUF1254 domain-containing protein n=1 Tax=Gordonia araii NBRC 100433 TaxID=1073574 RepID=G7GYZ8_9ACTN|nr:DUF1254 domain-containing protein [Gordonia araii]NNG97032.1 DUF1254 domain-containing protein [Gordonia araii NBRC 100433]GAB08823.1 hypothetical protein GOARA_021_00600 [Gordonia araii NBRC 100433]